MSEKAETPDVPHLVPLDFIESEAPVDIEQSKEGESDTQDDHVYPVLSTGRAICLAVLVMTSSVLQVSTGIGTSINVTSIAADLSISNGELQWIGSCSALATVCTLLLLGRLADLYGHKAIFIIGNTIGGVLLLGMSFSKNKYTFFVLKALSGCAFAASSPAAMGMLGRAFPEGPAKSRAFATLGAGAPVGTAVGLVLAGVTTQYTATGWRTFFFIATGLCAVIIFGTAFVAPGPVLPKLGPNQSFRTMDWLGIVLSGVGVFCIAFSLGYGESAPNGWTTPYVLALLVLGVVSIGLFFCWQHFREHRYHSRPLISNSIWKKGKFAPLMAIVLCLSGGFGSLIFWMTLYWQNYERRTIIQTTLRFLPLCVVGITANIIGSSWVAILSGQVMLLIGASATALAAVLFATCPAHYIYWAMQFPACCLCVWGADFMFLTSMLYLSRIAGKDNQGQMGGVFAMAYQIGGTIALAVTTIVSDHVSSAEATRLGTPIDSSKVAALEIPSEALLKGYRAAFWTCFGFSMVAALLIIGTLRGIGPVGRKKASPAQKQSASA